MGREVRKWEDRKGMVGLKRGYKVRVVWKWQMDRRKWGGERRAELSRERKRNGRQDWVHFGRGYPEYQEYEKLFDGSDSAPH